MNVQVRYCCRSDFDRIVLYSAKESRICTLEKSPQTFTLTAKLDIFLGTGVNSLIYRGDEVHGHIGG